MRLCYHEKGIWEHEGLTLNTIARSFPDILVGREFSFLVTKKMVPELPGFLLFHINADSSSNVEGPGKEYYINLLEGDFKQWPPWFYLLYLGVFTKFPVVLTDNPDYLPRFHKLRLKDHQILCTNLSLMYEESGFTNSVLSAETSNFTKNIVLFKGLKEDSTTLHFPTQNSIYQWNVIQWVQKTSVVTTTLVDQEKQVVFSEIFDWEVGDWIKIPSLNTIGRIKRIIDDFKVEISATQFSEGDAAEFYYHKGDVVVEDEIFHVL